MLTIEPNGEGVVVLKGRLDAAQAPAAQAQLDRLAGVVTLDMTGLDYISSAGLGVLLKTQKRLMASAGRLKLSGVGPHLRDIFVYSGFDQLFEIKPGP
jgi:anti-anti-sigma factor